MDELLSEFLTETAESLATLDVELVRLERDSSDTEVLGNIFRLMHTIKGTCGFLGLPRLGSLAHAGENVLGKFRDGELSVTPEAVTLILSAIDRIRLLLSELEANGSEPAGDDHDLIGDLDDMAEGRAAAPQASAPAPAAAAEITDAGFPVAAELLAEVSQALREKEVPDLPMEMFAEPEPAQATAAAPAPAAAAKPAPARAAQKPAADKAAAGEAKEVAAVASSLRVNVDVIENLMTLISELVLTRNQLLQIQRSQKGNDFKVPLQRLSHITSDLQDGVTRMRMQPIGNAWAKLPRIVRDLAVETGKKIELVMKGADTELDRQVLELIKDPLTHMVRNSADHGIEHGPDRLAAGKPECGTITLEAYHESGHIYIRIADDGRGLNVERIRQKAIANGLVGEGEAAGMSEQQILQFIFRPGFSTAEKVTSVSGRGVGMDVVRINIERIGGTIELNSEEGRGSSFLIKIPLTLAIVAALIIEVSAQRFAIPQINVVELVSISDRSGLRVEMIKNSPVLRLRDKLLPLVSLRTMLGLPDAVQGADRFVVVAQVGASTFGILVDRVFDTEEIVVKPLAPILRDTRSYMGNTILGDGSVIMILDPTGVSQAVLGGERKRDTGNAAANAANDDASEHTSLLLFRAGENELKAVPLELVARIEHLEAKTIEHVSGRRVVQYRERLMPLIPFDPGYAWTLAEQPVLVFSDGDNSMGLAVDEIVDIVRDRLQIQLSAGRSGLIGSAIICGQAVDVVDVGHFLGQGSTGWFGGKTKSSGPVRRALLVDDSAFFRSMIAPLLRAANWQVTTASDGAEALKLRDDGQEFDLVLSDVEMPNVDGLSLAEQIRSGSRWKDVPLIALSSRDTPADQEAGRVAGFNDYLSKADHSAMVGKLAATLRAIAEGDEASDQKWRKQG